MVEVSYTDGAAEAQKKKKKMLRQRRPEKARYCYSLRWQYNTKITQSDPTLCSHSLLGDTVAHSTLCCGISSLPSSLLLHRCGFEQFFS